MPESAAVRVVLDNSAAFSRRDVDAMLEFYAPDATVVDRRRVGFGTFRGHDELRTFYRGITEAAAEMREALRVLAADDETVVAHAELTGRLAGDPTGPVIGAEYGMVLTVREGHIQRLEIYDDGEDALAVSGLAAT